MQTRAAFQRLSGMSLYAIAALFSVICGWYLARTSSPKPLEAIGALVIAVTAYLRPRWALVGGLIVVALPYMWGPAVPKLGFGFGVLVGLLMVAIALPRCRGFEMTALDWAVLALAVSPAPIGYFQGQPVHLTLWLAPAITLPYFGFRLFFYANEETLRWFPPVIISVGVVVALLGLWETLSGRNPLVKAATPDYSSGVNTVWDTPLHRNGLLRAEATFGHPIALGMFLLIPLAFALSRPGRRYLWATVLILSGEAVTLSRGPWIGAVVVALILARWHRRRLIGVGTVLVLATWLYGPLNRLILQSGSASTQTGHNAAYRFGLIGSAFHRLSFIGHPNTDLSKILPNYADVTSLLAGTVLATGVVGLVELALIAFLVLRLLRGARADDDRNFLAAAAAIVGQLVGLLAVTLITNYQVFFWASLAYLVAVNAHRRNERQHLEPAAA
jgi:hypothetical protein